MRVQENGLRVGFEDDPNLKQLAIDLSRNLKVKLIRINRPQETLLEDLKAFKIHLMIGRLSPDSPWKKHVGFTRPYKDKNGEDFLLAIPPGENAFLRKVEAFLSERYERVK